METVMSNISIIKFNTNAIRIVMKDDDPWFVAADVCTALGIGNVTNAVRSLDDDEATLYKIKGSFNNAIQERKVNIVNESGLYALIMKSNKPEARKFRKWVTSEVLPSIRKTGQYVMRITPEQKGELQRLIAQRFPEGKHRPYAWSRFNNHFVIASYKDLPQRRFSEAVEYIKTMPLKSDEYVLVMLPKSKALELI
nr:MAG TPA: hypothetical protein [Caudoviricetes sp.]